MLFPLFDLKLRSYFFILIMSGHISSKSIPVVINPDLFNSSTLPHTKLTLLDLFVPNDIIETYIKLENFYYFTSGWDIYWFDDLFLQLGKKTNLILDNYFWLESIDDSIYVVEYQRNFTDSQPHYKKLTYDLKKENEVKEIKGNFNIFYEKDAQLSYIRDEFQNNKTTYAIYEKDNFTHKIDAFTFEGYGDFITIRNSKIFISDSRG